MAAYEEQQKLQKEDEASKTKAENGYDRSGHVELLIGTIQTQKRHWFSQDCVPGVAEIKNCLGAGFSHVCIQFKGFLGKSWCRLCRDVCSLLN